MINDKFPELGQMCGRLQGNMLRVPNDLLEVFALPAGRPAGGGGATPRFWMPTTPQLTVDPRPLRWGGGGMDGWMDGCLECCGGLLPGTQALGSGYSTSQPAACADSRAMTATGTPPGGHLRRKAEGVTRHECT